MPAVKRSVVAMEEKEGMVTVAEKSRGGNKGGLVVGVGSDVYRYDTPAGASGEVASEWQEVSPRSRGSLAAGLVVKVGWKRSPFMLSEMLPVRARQEDFQRE
ncbi:hypothetical protein Q9L58_010513, partial [Maublancomyces gigas]